MREILLPSLGEGVNTGTVVSILVKEGDLIEREQGLIEVETDKVTTEVPSDYAGRVSKILVQDGQEISQGETILLLDEIVSEQESVPNSAPSIALPNRSSQQEEVEPEAVPKLSVVDVDIYLPSLGEGVTGGTVVSLLVSKGEMIQAEQELIEVETDKVTMAVPSDYAGEVLDLYVKVGDEVTVGSAIIKIKPIGNQTVPQNEPAEEKIGQLNDQLSQSPELEYAASIKPPNLKELQAHGQIRSSSSSRTTPRARKLARQLNVDLQHVNASDGLITSDRIKSYVRSDQSNNTAPTIIDDAVAQKELPEFNQWGDTRIESMTGMMKATARNMSESWRTIPHAWLQEKANITSLERERKSLNQLKDIKLSTTVYIIKALTIALKEYPVFNASIDMSTHQIIYKEYYNVGVAVDTDHGLFVPVIKYTDKLSLTNIGDQLKNLAQLAKEKKLKAADLDGGNITISNLGVIGTTAIFPIILSPQVSIIGVAGYEVIDNQKILPLTIAFDHRVINGADAARFLSRIKQLLEHPYSLIFN